MDKDKTYLRRLVNTKKLRLKDVYTLITQKAILNRKAEQSRYLHDFQYNEKLNTLLHSHMYIEYFLKQKVNHRLFDWHNITRN